MLPKKPRYIYYTLVLLTLSIVFGVLKANPIVNEFIADVSAAVENINSTNKLVDRPQESNFSDKTKISSGKAVEMDITSSPMMFATIINGANEEVTCANDGTTTLAKFFLCGTGDDRTISVSGSGTITWQKLLSSCPFVGTDTCPVT